MLYWCLLYTSYTHIEEAKLIPLRNVPSQNPVNLSDEELLAWYIKNNKDLPKNKCTKILVYCFSGKRSSVASQMLVESGYKRVYNMQSGIIAVSYTHLFLIENQVNDIEIIINTVSKRRNEKISISEY